MKRAKALEDNFDFSKAAEIYESIAQNKGATEAIRAMARIKMLQRDFESSEEWYRSLDRQDGLTTPDYWSYAQILAFNSKFDESKIMLDRYKQKSGDQSGYKIIHLEESLEQGKGLLNRTTSYMATPLVELNTEFSEFGLVEWKKDFYFTSDKVNKQEKQSFHKTNAFKNNFYTWSGRGYTKVYKASIAQKDSTAMLFEPVNYDFHVGPLHLSENMAVYSKTQKPDVLDKFTLKKIDMSVFPGIYYRFILENGELDKETPFPFNNHLEFIFTDPFYDQISKKLYFSSNFENKDGGLNLYFSSLHDEGTWSDPQIVGSSIVTFGNERSPFIDKDGNLYFSSDGLPGLGGLDVFVVKNFINGGSTPENLGPPYNSNRDDFYYFQTATGDAFITSDRKGGKGFDDLYKVTINLDAKVILAGVVKDKNTNELIPNSILTAKNVENTSSVRHISEKDGTFKFILPAFFPYDLTANATDYFTADIKSVLKGDEIQIGKDSVFIEVFLSRMEVFKPIKIENIYYDFDKWELRDDAKVELGNLYQLMLTHPTIKIELHAHTDARGSKKYNQRLSDKRAKSVVDYLISRGISPTRLKAVGFGETQLVNDCLDEKECSEELHQQNRRTEFMIVEM